MLTVNILATTKRTFYIKGYKLDRQKIHNTIPREEDDDDEHYELEWYNPIIDHIPETAYKYVGCGVEADGGLNLVLVLDDGYSMTGRRWSLVLSVLKTFLSRHSNF